MPKNPNLLWFRWTLATAVAELLGLGGTLALAGWVIPQLDARQAGGILLTFGVAVLSGGLEATVVGLAQWWVLRPWFPAVGRGAWWRATLIGALLGYVLGYLPSTLMNLNEAATQTAVSEPPAWVTWLLAAGLGAVAGAVLSFFQWRVLRAAQVAGAGRWVPANMLAWAVGMPIIFIGMDLAFAAPDPQALPLIIAGALTVAGLAVGAVEGGFLARMAARPAAQTPPRR